MKFEMERRVGPTYVVYVVPDDEDPLRVFTMERGAETPLKVDLKKSIACFRAAGRQLLVERYYASCELPIEYHSQWAVKRLWRHEPLEIARSLVRQFRLAYNEAGGMVIRYRSCDDGYFTAASQALYEDLTGFEGPQIKFHNEPEKITVPVTFYIVGREESHEEEEV